MSVRCKFVLNSITRTISSRCVTNEDGSVKKDEKGYTVYEPYVVSTIKMSPVYSNDPNHENKKFWDASPGGQFELNCVNEQAVAQLELGQEYYLDIHPAPQEAPANAG